MPFRCGYGNWFNTSMFLLSSSSLAVWSSSCPLRSCSSMPRTSASHSLRLWFTMMSICFMSSCSSGSQDVRTELGVTWKLQITNKTHWLKKFSSQNRSVLRVKYFKGLSGTWHHDLEVFPKTHPFGSQRFLKTSSWEPDHSDLDLYIRNHVDGDHLLGDIHMDLQEEDELWKLLRDGHEAKNRKMILYEREMN